MESVTNNVKILVVDDEKAIVKSTAMYLKTKGYKNIYTLTDSRRIINFVNALKPDIILLDLNMPEINGHTVLTELNSLQKNLKIIVISAMDDSISVTKCKSLGAQTFLSKPVNNDDLLLSINDCIKNGSK